MRPPDGTPSHDLHRQVAIGVNSKENAQKVYVPACAPNKWRCTGSRIVATTGFGAFGFEVQLLPHLCPSARPGKPHVAHEGGALRNGTRRRLHMEAIDRDQNNISVT
jgi:hypothetical protein